MLQTIPLRLTPGQDLRKALEEVFVHEKLSAAFVLQGIGSLSVARVRYAGVERATEIKGDLEILTLAGSLSQQGAHLHICFADAAGQVLGGHVALGCIVRTTTEILLAVLPDYHFARSPDPQTGFEELSIMPQR
jgi:predicted DNA-binding protein with PD1-like motif